MEGLVTSSVDTRGHFSIPFHFPLLQQMEELCQNRKQGKMGRVRLNSQAQCGLGGVPVSEDTDSPPPPREALKFTLYCLKKT